MIEIQVPGRVTGYVVKNQGEYLQDVTYVDDRDIPVWTIDPDKAYLYESIVAFHDAAQYGGKVYAIIQEIYQND